MLYSILIEPEAINDLINIKKFITEQDSKQKAENFISELKQKIKSLEHMPQRCRKSYYSNIENTHDLIYKKYTIVYLISDFKVHILTVFRQKNYSS